MLFKDTGSSDFSLLTHQNAQLENISDSPKNLMTARDGKDLDSSARDMDQKDW